MAWNTANLVGQTFGRLTVVERAGTKNSAALWKCECRCGNFTEAITENLRQKYSAKRRSGGTKSCGHCKDQVKYPKEYDAWTHMKYRCYNKQAQNHHRYGGRGITVCDRWLEDFLNFLDDVGKAPYDDYSIERKENNGNYEPANCKWASSSDQARNR